MRIMKILWQKFVSLIRVFRNNVSLCVILVFLFLTDFCFDDDDKNHSCSERDFDFINWPFMSVHFWGENPNGEWKLKVRKGLLSVLNRS